MSKRRFCELCEEFAEVHHHTSYEPEETVPLCNDCHWNVHNIEGFHPELKPGQNRPASEELDYEPLSDKNESQMSLRDYEDTTGDEYVCSCGVIISKDRLLQDGYGRGLCPRCENVLAILDMAKFVLD